MVGPAVSLLNNNQADFDTIKVRSGMEWILIGP